jgi:hypothetical protein
MLEVPFVDKFAKCMEEIKKPKLTNQRLAWLIKRNPCRKAWLLGI